jgi:HK97 family phage prohead protease
MVDKINKGQIYCKEVPFQIKNVNESNGQFEGYASVFGNIDYGNDVVEKGAFTKTILESGVNWPILDNHDQHKQIGFNLEASQDEYGLKVKGELNLDTEGGKARYSLMKQAKKIGNAAKAGLSIGFEIMKWEKSEKDKQTIWHLTEVKMWEYSCVTFAMNPLAMVTDAKRMLREEQSFKSAKDLVNYIYREMKKNNFSTGEILEALQKEAAGLSDPNIEVIQSINEKIKNVLEGKNKKEE